MSLALVVLVADKDIEQAVLGLLDRHGSLGIRSLAGEFKVVVHPQRDPGVYNTGHELLKPFARNIQTHALIVFDRAWDGAPSTDAATLAQSVEERSRGDWGDRARCVCIDPEVENWVWSDSRHVAAELGWPSNAELRAWLSSHDLWPEGSLKPPDPKKAFERSTREKRVVPSSSIFGELARRVGLERCRDPAFVRLRDILREWFPRSDLSQAHG